MLIDSSIQAQTSEENQMEEQLDIPVNEIEDQNEFLKKYSLDDLLKSPSCVLSKEKNTSGKILYFQKNFMTF